MSLDGKEELASLILLFISCGILLCGFSLRKYNSGPWIMLLGIVGALLVIAYNILRHTGSVQSLL